MSSGFSRTSRTRHALTWHRAGADVPVAVNVFAPAIANAGLPAIIAIDDFGSGYSALSYLRDLPPEEVLPLVTARADGTSTSPLTTPATAPVSTRSS
ncbi:EAL domain-containing protein [Mycolicibacterium sarraceniae]|uniref:hypothetical protein n=1 Tax=Mycolicibacterium sarraceniae TaxID=1534348 RepID=UPI0013D684C9|nr:hypothetical protein [Mycolicibacterium sarraceniae]